MHLQPPRSKRAASTKSWLNCATEWRFARSLGRPADVAKASVRMIAL